MYIRFEDFEKAFNSVHRHSLWFIINKIYGKPQKLIKMIKALYDDFHGSVMEDKRSQPLFLWWRVSFFLFLLLIDWEMQQMVKKEISGIHWNFTTMLEDFDFVDDIAQQQWTIYSSRQQSWKTTQLMWDETKCQEMQCAEGEQQERS